MAPSSNPMKLTEIARRTPRPYSSKIALNGTFRTQTKPVSPQVQQAFDKNTGHSYAGRQGQPPDSGSGGKTREDELVSFVGSQFDR